MRITRHNNLRYQIWYDYRDLLYNEICYKARPYINNTKVTNQIFNPIYEKVINQVSNLIWKQIYNIP
jgi:hypothetical protein